MKKFSIPVVFWALVGVFILVLCQFFIPAVRDILRSSLWFLLPIAIFFLLGLVLLVLTLKQKIERKLRKFLILTSASAIGFFLSILLHNFIYGLFIYFFGQDFWERIGLGDEPFFFIVAIFICPIGFLVGMIGSIILLVKKGRQG